ADLDRHRRGAGVGQGDVLGPAATEGDVRADRGRVDLDAARAQGEALGRNAVGDDVDRNGLGLPTGARRGEVVRSGLRGEQPVVAVRHVLVFGRLDGGAGGTGNRVGDGRADERAAGVRVVDVTHDETTVDGDTVRRTDLDIVDL